MENVSPIAAVYLLAVLVVTYVLYKRGGKKYAAMIEPLSKDDFGLKDIFPIGFTLMEMAKYQYSSAFDRKIRRQLVELYDPDYTEYYLRVYWGAAASYVVIGLLMSAILAVGVGVVGAVLGLAVGVVMAYACFNDIEKKIEERHTKITIDMPDFTNKILILSGAGLTLRAAIIKISHEMANDTPLYHELAHSVQMMENGVTDEAALGHLEMRCNTPQMRRFTSVIIQNLNRGGTDVLLALQDIGQEQWAERKAAAIRVSAEADTKLLFPMMLMLGSVIIMTIAPAVMSIQM